MLSAVAAAVRSGARLHGDRAVLRLAGADATTFLQNSLASDVRKAPAPAVMLNHQGRFVHDAFLVPSPDGYLLDADRDAAPHLAAALKKMLMRAKVTISDESDRFSVLVSRDASDLSSSAFADVRAPHLGWRAIVPSADPLATAASSDYDEEYHLLRMLLGVPQGLRELPPGELFPFEANMDYCNAVSVSKGCYLGQELTNRTYHRGAVHKRVIPVVLGDRTDAVTPGFAPILSGSAITAAGAARSPGRIIASLHNVGLALLRLDAVGSQLSVAQSGRTVAVHPVVPEHWPKELSRAFLREFEAEKAEAERRTKELEEAYAASKNSDSN